MTLGRRSLLKLTGAAALIATIGGSSRGQMPQHMASPPKGSPEVVPPQHPPADHVIRIGTGVIDLGQDMAVSTKLYNGQFPGPLLRLTEGKRVVVDIHNDTDTPEQLHWHGQFVSADIDGAEEEGSPAIPPRGMRRVAFAPGPSGFRFYHSHATAGTDLSAGTYSGQAGLVYIEPRQEPGAYDQEVFLTLKEFGPYLTRAEMAMDFLSPETIVPELRAAAQASLDASTKQGLPDAYELGYNFFTINGRVLGGGEPVRVKPGQCILFHILNASATEIHGLALPGHRFKVVALDGNPVPIQAAVPALWLGPAERISALVEMNQPGIWILGELDEEARKRGMGIVIEYADRSGKPEWMAPPESRWDYRLFGNPDVAPAPVDETIELMFATRNGAREGFDEFSINGTPFSMAKMQPRFHLKRGKRYRLRLRNATDDTHPLHFHRHNFELTSIAGEPTSGVAKDVVLLGGFQEMTVDFTADQPGLSLFHCHMQHHMDFGFMALFDCA
jgi:FtsP/CotA-like multicopper oxidase with cupredoxin domain